MNKENIIFIYPKLFTFIRTEIKLLSDDFKIISISQSWNNKWMLPINLIIQFFFLLINIWRTQYVLISFGGYWSFLPSIFGKIFRKKVFIVVHGTDCVDFPDISYGNLRKTIMRFFIKKSYEFATMILPVSESLVYTENNYFSSKTLTFGYSYHLKGITTPYHVIPNGLIDKDWKRNKTCKRDNKAFITVMTYDQLERKGAPLIIDIADKFPECKFFFAGVDKIPGDLPKNIFCLGRVTPKELLHQYSMCQFYLQLSNFEGFGVAICEAMLCECVPIASNVNFLPNIVGDTGFILNRRDVDKLEGLIRNALNADMDNLGLNARKRIQNQFSLDKRRSMILDIIKN